MTSQSEEIIGIKKKLEEADVEGSETLDMLRALNKIDMTKALLKATKIGVTINNIKKKTTTKSVAAMAESLVKDWKDKVAKENGGASSAAPPKRSSGRAKEPVNYTEEKVEAPAAAILLQHQESGGGGASIYPDLAPPPTRDAKTGKFKFSDHPEFQPNLSPKEVLQMGSFGGTYFRPIYSSVTGKNYGAEVYQELPQDWLKSIDIKTKVASSTYRNSVNTYGVKCGGDLNMWESSGWIKGIDPYGWFQWYCRFFHGRRSDDDERQIARGNQCMGPTGRWRSNLCGKIISSANKGGKCTLETELNNHKISPVIRQVLQHWGYKLRLEDVAAYKKKKGL